jgi:hypothetical protein
MAAIALEVALEADHPQADGVTEAEWQTWFSLWGQHLALEGSPLGAYELSLKLTTDAAIAELNQVFRQVDGPTDVPSAGKPPGLRPTASYTCSDGITPTTPPWPQCSPNRVNCSP